MTGKEYKVILQHFYFWLTQSSFPKFICGFTTKLKYQVLVILWSLLVV